MKSKLLIVFIVAGSSVWAYGQSNAPAVQNGVPYQSKAVIRLDVPGEIGALQQTPFENRETVVADVKKHVSEAHHEVVKLRVKNDITFHHPSGDLKAQYDLALDNEKTARSDIDACLKAAKATNDPESWDHARGLLVVSYERYAEAVGNAEACASGNPPRPLVAQH